MKKLALILILLTSSTLTACSFDTFGEEQTAMRVASPAWMVKREIATSPFKLIGFERMHERFAPATIYIEGNGFGDSLPSAKESPTPENPVALHLASKDQSENVAYLARPCQYSAFPEYTYMKKEDNDCASKFWTGSRHSKTVINAYHEALNEIRDRYDLKGFHLVGYDGGAAIATILAASRGDTLSLRTVAGDLDSLEFTAHHKQPPLDDSLNPIDFAEKLRNLPQIHYIGGQDDVIPPAILSSYLAASKNSPCVKDVMIQEAEHQDGWVENWPALYKNMPTCSNTTGTLVDDIPMAELPEFIPSNPRPVFRPREPGLEK